MNISLIKKKLKEKLDKDRYQHTLGVASVSIGLAMRYEEDVEKANLAALLHDCAKCYSDSKKYALCEKYQVFLSDSEKANPSLVHAKLGAYVAADKYEISDSDILSAITWHTTGRAGMTVLEKIIFVADYIEPGRTKQKNLKEIRKMAFIDIDEAIYLITRDTLEYLSGCKNTIDPTTMETYLYYKAIHDEKQTNHGGK